MRYGDIYTRWFQASVVHRTICIVISAGMLAALSALLLFHQKQAADSILLVAIAISAFPILIETSREVLRLNFSVDILADVSILTALLLHQYWVAAIVILMLSGGKTLEEIATRRASSVLSALAKRMPQIAHRIKPDGSAEDVLTGSINVGDHVILYPHELCPVDGTVVEGSGGMDESYLTGEPFLISKAPGTIVLSGAIVEVLHASEQNRPQIRRLGDRIGGWYTPLALAVACASWFFSADSERFLAVLVIATPCPLLIAIPVAIIGAISVGARYGIIIKDPSILEKLGSCRTLIVDKTGTLTYGKPILSEILLLGHFSRELVLQLAASLERYSKHPLAKAVLTAASDVSLPALNAEDVSESPGEGLMGTVGGHSLTLTGRGKLSHDLAHGLPPVKPGLECVVLIDDELAGLLYFQDQPRQESRPFITHLGSRHNIEKVVLLSGDRPAEVSLFAARMGIWHALGGKSPEQKVEIVREMTAQTPTLYIGDGINDAPAMLNATAGIALGVNSDITSEAAGAVILQSSLGSVDELIHIGRRMRRIALQSALGGMTLSLIGMGAAAAGYLTPIQGALLQELIDLLSILNSLRMIVPSGPLSDFTMTTAADGKESTRKAPYRLAST
jgi:cation transport ATPase